MLTDIGPINSAFPQLSPDGTHVVFVEYAFETFALRFHITLPPS